MPRRAALVAPPAVRVPGDRRRLYRARADAAGHPVLAGGAAVEGARHRAAARSVVEHAGGDGLGPVAQDHDRGRRPDADGRRQGRGQDIRPHPPRRPHRARGLLRQPVRDQPADLRSRVPAALRRLRGRQAAAGRRADGDRRRAGAVQLRAVAAGDAGLARTPGRRAVHRRREQPRPRADGRARGVAHGRDPRPRDRRRSREGRERRGPRSSC